MYFQNTTNNKHPRRPQFLDDQTLTPCGHSEACRSSSQWHDRQHPGSQSGQTRSPWSHFHHKPPGAEEDKWVNMHPAGRHHDR